MDKNLCLALGLLLSGCASNQPVIYAGPTGGDRAVSDAAAAECGRLATAAGASQYGGEVGGVAKDTVRGAATGAAVSLVQKLFVPAAPNPAYRAFVERCLQDKGYQTGGWN